MEHTIIKSMDTLAEVLSGPAHHDILVEQTADFATEKHVPYIEEQADGYLVKVGKETPHPMTPEHWIQFIELIIDGNRVYRHFLSPNDAPETFFKVEKGSNVIAREYCNLHGLWKFEK